MSDSQLFPAPLTDTSASMNVLGIYKFLAIFIITQEEKRKMLHTPPRLGYIASKRNLKKELTEDRR